MATTGSRENLRNLVVQTISDICSQGWKKIIIENSYLTPEDSEATHIHASYLLHKAHSVFWPHLYGAIYEQVRSSVREDGLDINLLPTHTTSEEEAVSTVR